MPKHMGGAFNLWLIRVAAMRCRTALVRANGCLPCAARSIGIGVPTMRRVIERDNRLLDSRAHAEGWQPDHVETTAPVSE
jgi:hypothetical protein